MLNKNVADYTNFEGKTNKRIVQAPGGTSSISLAWPSEKPKYSKNIDVHPNQQDNDRNYNIYNNLNYKSEPKNNNSYSNNTGNYPVMENIFSPMQVGGEYGYSDNHYSYQNNIASLKNRTPIKTINSIESYSNYSSPYSNYQQSPRSLNNLGNEGNYNPYNPYMGSSPLNNDKYIQQQINSINFGIRGVNNKRHSQNQNSRNYQAEKNYSNYTSSTLDNSAVFQNKYSPNIKNNQSPLRNQGYESVNHGNYKEYLHKDNQKSRQQEIDVALKHQYNKNKSIIGSPQHSTSTSDNQYQYRPSVKIIGPPPMQFMVGDPNYNFWKDDQGSNGRQVKSHKRMPQSQVHTSVKINSPPGGKQSLVLG